MSMWIRTIALSMAALWLVGCSGVAQRQLAQDAVTAMGGADKLMGIQSLIMSGGTGTRTKVGQPMTPTGMDQIAELTNNVETLDLANGRAAYDYDVKVGDFAQHRCGGGESVAQLMARVASAFAQARGGGQDGLWITHAGVVRAVRLLTRGVALPRAAADWPVEGLPFGASECLALDPG